MGEVIRLKSTRRQRPSPRKFPRGRRSWRPNLRPIANRLGLIAALVMGLLASWYAGVGEFAREPLHGGFRAIDGDSIRGARSEIRLEGIDAPELHQSCEDAGGHPYACGLEAKAALHELIAGRTLSCSSRGRDKYGRSLAFCKAGDLDINGEMARQGWAIAFMTVSIRYRWLELEARREGRGIWRGRFDNPQTWREKHRVVRGDTGGIPAAED